MEDRYSIGEARAKLSAIVRAMREGRRAVITVRGEPVAEVRPYEVEPDSLPERIRHLQRTGAVVASERSDRTFETVARRKGALARFLAERAEDRADLRAFRHRADEPRVSLESVVRDLKKRRKL